MITFIFDRETCEVERVDVYSVVTDLSLSHEPVMMAWRDAVNLGRCIMPVVNRVTLFTIQTTLN